LKICEINSIKRKNKTKENKTKENKTKKLYSYRPEGVICRWRFYWNWQVPIAGGFTGTCKIPIIRTQVHQ
jgi:hypothetical protein